MTDPTTAPGWRDPHMVAWVQLLLTSYQHWTRRALIEPTGTAEAQAEALFHAPFVVVSHGMEGDPILNYGNQAALTLWETTWAELRRTPSRLTAEPGDQSERAEMLTRAEAQGYVDDYRGIRISRLGHRFLIERAVVWNVMNGGRKVGQAASFSSWTWLP